MIGLRIIRVSLLVLGLTNTILIMAVLLGGLISIGINIRFLIIMNRYDKVSTKRGYNGLAFLNELNDKYRICREVMEIRGGKKYSACYNAKEKTIAVSKKLLYKSSIASLATAAHEYGHALQNASGDKGFWLYSRINPFICTLKRITLPLFLIGVFIWEDLVLLSAVCFLVIMLFYLITLRIEIDASNWALRELKATKVLTKQELKDAKKCLRAAALTYVGSFFEIGITLSKNTIRFA